MEHGWIYVPGFIGCKWQQQNLAQKELTASIWASTAHRFLSVREDWKRRLKRVWKPGSFRGSVARRAQKLCSGSTNSSYSSLVTLCSRLRVLGVRLLLLHAGHMLPSSVADITVSVPPRPYPVGQKWFPPSPWKKKGSCCWGVIAVEQSKKILQPPTELGRKKKKRYQECTWTWKLDEQNYGGLEK